jgi:hypothetical protein
VPVHGIAAPENGHDWQSRQLVVGGQVTCLSFTGPGAGEFGPHRLQRVAGLLDVVFESFARFESLRQVGLLTLECGGALDDR